LTRYAVEFMRSPGPSSLSTEELPG